MDNPEERTPFSGIFNFNEVWLFNIGNCHKCCVRRKGDNIDQEGGDDSHDRG